MRNPFLKFDDMMTKRSNNPTTPFQKLEYMYAVRIKS
jgi:hypothetical protein